jgi:multiple sugar transport system substrate-binding protein
VYNKKRNATVTYGLILALLLVVTVSQLAAAQSVVRALLVGGLDHQEVWETLIPIFEEETGVKVEWTSLPRDQLIVRATTMGQAESDYYDVYSTHFSYIPQFHTFLEPLQLHFSQEDLNDFAPSSLEGSTMDGNIYMLPRYLDGRMLFYRTDLFEEAGLEPPTSWQELLDIALKLTDQKSGMYGFIQVGQGNPIMRHFSDFLWQAGGDFLDENYRPIFHGPEGVKALQFIVDLVHKHQVSPPGLVGFGWTEARTLFAQGVGAMLYEWPSGPPHYDDPERSVIVGKYSFAPIPGDVTDISTAVYHGFSINKHSSNKDLAVKFIGWMTSKEAQHLEYQVRGTLPARLSAAQEIIDGATGVERDRLLALKAVGESGRSWPVIPEMAQIERVIYEELEKALSLQKTVEQALNDAASKVEAIMVEAGYY